MVTSCVFKTGSETNRRRSSKDFCNNCDRASSAKKNRKEKEDRASVFCVRAKHSRIKNFERVFLFLLAWESQILLPKTRQEASNIAFGNEEGSVFWTEKVMMTAKKD